MITDKDIQTFSTKEQALDIYRTLMEDPDLHIGQFMEWAEFSRQAYYSWPSPLSSALRFQLYGRLTLLKQEREQHDKK
jgi:hypothetical protein